MNDKIKELEQNQIEVDETYQLEFYSVSKTRVCLSTTKIDYIQELGFGVVLDRTDSFSRVVPLVFISSDDARKFRDDYYNKIRIKNKGFIKNPYQLQVIQIKGKRNLIKIHSNVDIFVTIANYKFLQPKINKLNNQSQKAQKERDTFVNYQEWVQNIDKEAIKYGWRTDLKTNEFNHRITFSDDKFSIPIILYNTPGKNKVEIISPQKLNDHWYDFFSSFLNGSITIEDINGLHKHKIIQNKFKPILEKVYNILNSHYPLMTIRYTIDNINLKLNSNRFFIEFENSHDNSFDWNNITKLDIDFSKDRDVELRNKVKFNNSYSLCGLITCYCYLNYNKSFTFDFQKDGYKPIIDFLNYIRTINYMDILDNIFNKNLVELIKTSKEMLKTKQQS